MRTVSSLALTALAILVVAVVALSSSGATTSPAPTIGGTAGVTTPDTTDHAATDAAGSGATLDGLTAPPGMPVIDVDDLPSEALDTLALIDAGGPFPFRQDGATFENREGLLPDRPRGHYREYTVITPGSDDRGARRIVTGEDGEAFWTDDHYDSFRWVLR